MINFIKLICLILAIGVTSCGTVPDSSPSVAPPTLHVEPISVSAIVLGYAQSSVNTVIFRKDPLAPNEQYQYVAYYNSVGIMMLGRRALGEHAETQFKVRETQFLGRVSDAHNAISLAVDGNGYLHVAWALHNKPLPIPAAISFIV